MHIINHGPPPLPMLMLRYVRMIALPPDPKKQKKNRCCSERHPINRVINTDTRGPSKSISTAGRGDANLEIGVPLGVTATVRLARVEGAVRIVVEVKGFGRG